MGPPKVRLQLPLQHGVHLLAWVPSRQGPERRERAGAARGLSLMQPAVQQASLTGTVANEAAASSRMRRSLGGCDAHTRGP